jgi:hypothetical protein
MIMTKYLDFPIDECAETLARLMPTLPPGSAFFQKWTCAGCGERVTGCEPNRLFTGGKHEDCGHVTDLEATGCNYMLHIVGGLATMPPQGQA